MFTLDGKEYNVDVIYPTRIVNFEIVEGSNSGLSLSFREIRDIAGTRYDYEMLIEPKPNAPEDMDALFWAVSAPVESHRVIMPMGQETLEFEAVVRSGSATDYGVVNGKRRWKHLQLVVTAIEPQRRPD